MRSRLFLLALLCGCIEDVGRGPDLGDCAFTPEGIFTYGEIGVGTCLASPADLAFWQDNDGKTWLGVANANHYYNFDSGSVLVIDWDSVDKTPGSTNLMSELTASAVAPGNFVGGVAHVGSRDLLLVTERFSDEASTAAYQDDLLVLDVSDPATMDYWAEGERLTVQDDPQPIVVDDAQNRAYVLNLTDHSISVVDLSTTPLQTLNVTAGAGISTDPFVDGDASGSTASFSSAEILEEGQIIDDQWNLTWVGGTVRLWVPTDGGLHRWHSGGGDWVPTGTGQEIDPTDIGLTQIQDPYFMSLDGFPVMYFASEGNIYNAGVSDGTATNWVLDPIPAIVGVEGSGFDDFVGAPCLVDTGGFVGMYYDARANADGPAVITAAFLNTAGQLERGTASLFELPTGISSMEDPFVLFDTQTGTFRMWMSLWDGAEWHVGTSTSYDGEIWAEAIIADGLPGQSAAPTVTQSRGRFEIWYAHGDGSSWAHASAWSWDGFTWYDSEDKMAADDAAFELLAPPRVAAQGAENGGFRVEGADGGLLTGLAYPGILFRNAEYGLSFQVATGFEAEGPELHENFENGITPSSHVEIGGTQALFVHGLGSDGNNHVGILNINGAPPSLIAFDVLPASTLGALSQPSHPVVFDHDGGYRMVFSATNSEGQTQLYLAHSDDGLNWTSDNKPLAEDGLSWHESAKHARSVEQTDDGGLRLWYSGTNGSRLRIGSALWDDSAQDFIPEAGNGTDWVFGTGTPGTFDDTHVTQPVVFEMGDETHLIYAAFDGEIWSIGHAVRQPDGTFLRSVDGLENPRPALRGTGFTFSHGGVNNPVLTQAENGEITIWYAGVDSFGEEDAIARLGIAAGTPETLFAHQRFPTPEDTLSFQTHRSDNETNVIELSQRVDAFNTSNGGASQIRLDSERGFLYVTAKVNNYIYVIDIRDDSEGDFVDSNYLDIEALIAVESNVGSRGFRDVVVPPGTNRLYAAGQRPDAVVAFDISALEDNGVKEVYRDLVIGSLPLQPSIGNEADQGSETGLVFSERFGGGNMALTQGDLLLVTQFLDNSVSVFDLAGAGIGTEVRYLSHIGENPYAIAVSPDHRYAVVANYVGKTLDNSAKSSTLVVIDLDKQNDTFLEPLTWISNR